jgi:hypothetical protein
MTGALPPAYGTYVGCAIGVRVNGLFMSMEPFHPAVFVLNAPGSSMLSRPVAAE